MAASSNKINGNENNMKLKSHFQWYPRMVSSHPPCPSIKLDPTFELLPTFLDFMSAVLF